ncbi:MAG TPA: helical backbone metal receptor [Ornithinibacter sp.]|nr:helical backbone metal receptor [Ornithinibacter sp.]
MSRTLPDDLGHLVELPDTVGRVVSLVPSLSEALAASCPERLVGVTDWCTHPRDLDARGVARVRGTKNPDLTAVAALHPDLVIANKEENRELDVRRLRERGIRVWVTDIETVPQAVASMRRLLRDVLALEADPAWLLEAEDAWCGRVPAPRERAVVPVWRDPWMVVGRPTFTADLLRRVGVEVVTGGVSGRYPGVAVEALDDPAVADVVLLPDEPYVFTADDGPEAFRRVPTRLVSGRLLTWYGPALVESRISLERS